MTIVNRRNAVVGWLTLKVAKIFARQQARVLAQKLHLAHKSSKR